MLDIEKLVQNFHEYVERSVIPLHERIRELEGRQPAKGEKGEKGEKGDPGKDADVGEIVRSLAESDEVAGSLDDRVAKAVADYFERNPPTAGKDGRDGTDGKDADPQEIVRELIATDELAPILELHAAKAAEAYFAEHPPLNGKDGAPGRDGEDGKPGKDGEKGMPGQDGKDGVGLAGAMIDREGSLIITLTNGETKALGPVVGRDGEPGKDGADFSGFEVEYDGERSLTIKGKGGEIVKHLPIPLDRGYYRDGMKAEKGDILTHDGNAWLALRDTKTKPCRENSEDWRLFARKGRDGRDGKDGKPPPGPVKLNHD